MAKLPDETAFGERQAPSLPRRSPMVAEYHPTTGFEGAGADQMAHTAREFDSASVVVLQEKQRADTLAAEDAFNKLRQKQSDLTYGPGGLINQKGAAAVNRDLPSEYGAQLKDASDELGAGLSNDNQRRLFARRAATSQLEMQQSAYKHVAQQSDVYAGDVLEGTVATETNAAAQNPETAPLAAVRIAHGVQAYAERFGKPQEWIDEKTAQAKSTMYSKVIEETLDANPGHASQIFREVQNELTASDRVVVGHRVNQAMIPAQAKSISDYVVGRNPAALASLQSTLADGGEAAIQSVAQQLEATDQQQGVTPSKTRDMRAMLGSWIADAEKLAEATRPGDVVFRDTVTQQVKNQVSTMLAVQQGVQSQAQGVLLTAAIGGADGKAPKPTTLDQLLAMPGARDAYAQLDPQSAAGIRANIDHNALEAERGTPIRSDSRVVMDAFTRIHLADDDPRKISRPEQLTSLLGHGANRADLDWLRKEVNENQTVGGRNFTTDVQNMRVAARTMLMRSYIGSTFPEKGEEASYRFNFDLSQKIEDYRKAGKDPRSLLTPGTPDYALAPERVASFMPGARQVIAEKADKVREGGIVSSIVEYGDSYFRQKKEAAGNQTYEVGKIYNFNQGSFKYSGGDPQKQSSFEPVKPVAISGDADLDKLPPGAPFVGPDGAQRVKPEAPAAPQLVDERNETKEQRQKREYLQRRAAHDIAQLDYGVSVLEDIGKRGTRALPTVLQAIPPLRLATDLSRDVKTISDAVPSDDQISVANFRAIKKSGAFTLRNEGVIRQALDSGLLSESEAGTAKQMLEKIEARKK